jgi:uncharacterized protein (TIGR02246 family)
MRLLPTGGALAALALLAACAKPPAPVAAGPDTAAIRTAILAQLGKIEASFAAKDTTAVRAAFTDDAVWIMEDASTSRGGAEIVKKAAEIFAVDGTFKIESSTLDELVVVNDNEVVTFSTWNYTVAAKGKETHHINPFADIWRKSADGTWKIAREINASGVVPAPKAAAKP